MSNSAFSNALQSCVGSRFLLTARACLWFSSKQAGKYKPKSSSSGQAVQVLLLLLHCVVVELQGTTIEVVAWLHFQRALALVSLQDLVMAEIAIRKKSSVA
jgi:hypothetical protein